MLASTLRSGGTSIEKSIREIGGCPMARYRISLFLLLAASSMLVWALPSAAHQSTVKATTVTVTAGKPSEFRFTLLPKKVKHGIVTFKVTNKGGLPHDFKIAGHKTKLLTPGQTQ